MKGILKGFSGNWSNGQQEITMRMSVIQFEEDNNHIYYCPALDLSGYGATEEEAKESFEVSLKEFFAYSTNKNTLRLFLKKMGWQLRRSKRKPMVPPNMIDLLQNNDNFSRIFNTHDFHKTETSINIPAIA